MRVVIIAVVLAAGASSRMGRPKPLLPTRVPGETFLSAIVTTLRAAGIPEVVIVTPAATPEVTEAARRLDPPSRVVENPHADPGQLSSLLCALALVDRPGVQAMLVTLVDVPLVRIDTVAAVLAAYNRTGAPIVRPAVGGRHGHPVVFDRRIWPELRRADPAAGAKAVIRVHAREIVDVRVDDPGAFEDIDTLDDYERVFGGKP